MRACAHTCKCVYVFVGFECACASYVHEVHEQGASEYSVLVFGALHFPLSLIHTEFTLSAPLCPFPAMQALDEIAKESQLQVMDRVRIIGKQIRPSSHFIAPTVRVCLSCSHVMQGMQILLFHWPVIGRNMLSSL